MKIVIISDIHDNLPNLEKCLDFCQQNKIEIMICCGDVTNSDTLKYMAENFAGIIYLVRGNMEIYDNAETGQYKNINFLGRYGIVEINNKKVGICHEPVYINKVIKLSEENSSKCDIIFYGHTHQPWEEKRDGVGAINPGTLAGTFSKATFAIWNTKNNEIELKLIELI